MRNVHAIHLTGIVSALLFCAFCSASFDADEDVIFKLYKRDEPTKFIVLKINGERLNSTNPFDPELPTRVHIHGYLAEEEIIDRYRQAYLSIGDYNFIVVDWLEGAFTLNYFKAKKRVSEVSKISWINVEFYF